MTYRVLLLMIHPRNVEVQNPRVEFYTAFNQLQGPVEKGKMDQNLPTTSHKHSFDGNKH